MTETDLVDRLAAHRTLGRVPRRELEWLAAHATMLHVEAGGLLSSKGVPVDSLYVMLSGHFAIYIDRPAGGRHKAMEWWGGDVGGLLPYSRLVNPPRSEEHTSELQSL